MGSKAELIAREMIASWTRSLVRAGYSECDARMSAIARAQEMLGVLEVSPASHGPAVPNTAGLR
jgi:hypothetical protein